MKWQPWEDFKDSVTELPISEPPCRHCKHWWPRILTTDDGIYNGVRLCHAKDQCQDFSCYKERPEAAAPAVEPAKLEQHECRTCRHYHRPDPMGFFMWCGFWQLVHTLLQPLSAHITPVRHLQVPGPNFGCNAWEAKPCE